MERDEPDVLSRDGRARAGMLDEAKAGGGRSSFVTEVLRHDNSNPCHATRGRPIKTSGKRSAPPGSENDISALDCEKTA
jgi:hypothetical protein